MRQQRTPETTQLRAEIGARLRKLRFTVAGLRGSRLNLSSLCQRVGVSVSSWPNWEKGATMPPEILLRVIVEFHIRPEWLLTGIGTMFSHPVPPPRAPRSFADIKHLDD
jgi:hypothetical protein